MPLPKTLPTIKNTKKSEIYCWPILKINKDLKKLSYTNSHDLRSPVNNLLSIFSLLDVSKIEDEETLQFIEMLKSTSESLRQALNDYVDILILEENNNAQIEQLSLEESLKTMSLVPSIHSFKIPGQPSMRTFQNWKN